MRIGCDSDEEKQVARGRPSSTNLISRCLNENLSGETADHCRYWPVPTDIESCSYVPSPIYRLPADVLCSIFELYCRVELPVKFPLQFTPTQLIASQVCSAWRQIMLGNPIFWNKISIVFYGRTRYDQTVEVSHIWLSRAKGLPCFVDLRLSYNHPLWRLDINKNVVQDLIAPHKCKHLQVTFEDHHLHDLLELPDEKLSCIEVLDLSHAHNGANREAVSLLDFHRLTNLTSFSLDLTAVLHRTGLVPITQDQYFQIFSGIPWHQLCHIHLHARLPVLCCLTVLETSSSVLETCSLSISEDLPFATSPLSQKMPIHCQKLRKFHVYIYSRSTLDAGSSFKFLLLLRLPKLRLLTLRYHSNTRVLIDLRTLFRMWSVCTMRLEKLVIAGFMCSVDVEALLATMPSLRCLILPRKSIFTVDTIRELGAGSIGPFLEELIITNSGITDEIGELIQMVKTRSSSTEKENSALEIKPTPFKSVYLCCDDPDGSLRQKYHATIDEIKQLGVELTVEFLDVEED